MPIILLVPVVYVSLKAYLKLGITFYITTFYQLINLGNSIVPTFENRATPSLVDNTRRFKILFAKDNTINQRLAVKVLEKYYYVVTVAGNGKEAVQAVTIKQFNVILIDVQILIIVGFYSTVYRFFYVNKEFIGRFRSYGKDSRVRAKLGQLANTYYRAYGLYYDRRP